jgi:hypothetical protein
MGRVLKNVCAHKNELRGAYRDWTTTGAKSVSGLFHGADKQGLLTRDHPKEELGN